MILYDNFIKGRLTCVALQVTGGTKTITRREHCHICCPNTQSGPRSPLKRLPESCEEAAVLEPVLRACLLPLAASGAQGSQTVLEPQQVNPLKSLHIDETMVGLSLALLPRARPKSKSTALFKLSGSTQPFNKSDYFIKMSQFLGTRNISGISYLSGARAEGPVELGKISLEPSKLGYLMQT